MSATIPALHDWLARPAIHTHHRRDAAVAPGELWAAATAVRLEETRTLGRLVQWRIPGTPGATTFRALFAARPFLVLDEGEHWSLSGLCGRIWTLRRDYPHLADPADFHTWSEPATARVLLGHWVEPAGPGRSAIVSETRVEPVDARARLALRLLWGTIGPFERRIGGEALALAARRASGRAG